ncbi:AAA family ATPase [Rhodococcus zopfii]|uniref:AAA family ATPase n=1 Tax=Rhodococcus zopfii TaxID=43772 RepID=A0ABU3WRS6_9NOCA|nr:AAA family ATPase [Rhodococcus zopfii]
MTDNTRGATGSVRTGEDTEPAAATNSNRQARNGYSHDADMDFRENGPGSESYHLGRTLPDPVQSAIRTVRNDGELPGDDDLYRKRLEYHRADQRARETVKVEEHERRTRVARANLPAERPLSLREHLAVDDEIEYTWTVPGRLPQGCRMIVTADEGFGKSTLVRYLGGAAAAGVDPFDWANRERYEPKRVLLVDCENDYTLARKRMQELAQRWDARVPGAGDLILDNMGFMSVEAFGKSLSLEDPYDAERLRSWVEDGRYDIVLIGPVYQLTDETDHDAAFNAIVSVLGKLREEFGFSTILEAHTPHDSSTLRPYGSSLWKRWPEIGMHFGGANGKVTQWRGNRYGDDVQWPDLIRREPDGQVMFSASRPSVGEVAQQDQAQAQNDLRRLVELVGEAEDNKSRTFGSLQKSLGCGNDRFKAALELGQHDGQLRVEDGPRRSKLVFLDSSPSEGQKDSDSLSPSEPQKDSA